LIVWGWGQVAAGDRRGWILPIVQLALVAVLLAIGPGAAQGTNAWLVFLAAAVVFALWAAIPVHAYRRAVQRHAALDVPLGRTGGLDLLWLAPIAVVFSTVFWSVAARTADPGTVLADYAADWRAGRAETAVGRFEMPPSDPSGVRDAWTAQLAKLRNDLVRLAAVSGPGSGIDPEDPLASIHWAARDDGEPGTYIVDIEVVRRETIRGQLLGLVPSTSQRLVPLEKLGVAELRLVDLPGPLAGNGWRIVRVEVGGTVLGS
jgi:hypothetical protein